MAEPLNNWATKYAHVPILSIEEMRALPAPQEFDAGIYFCWLKGGLTYIGKSKHICERLYIQGCMNRNLPFYQTIRAKEVPFDEVTCIVLHTGQFWDPKVAGQMTEYERAYIARYEPAFNMDYVDGFT